MRKAAWVVLIALGLLAVLDWVSLVINGNWTFIDVLLASIFTASVYLMWKLLIFIEKLP